MIDHASTYRSRRLRHWHHRARLRQLLAEVREFRHVPSVADIGCSNGYITNLLSEVCLGEIHGFDYLPELVDEAQALHPHIRFRRADLNRVVKWNRQFDLVCCFETLEHVGRPAAALKNVLAAVRAGGTLIVSVPVETGAWGIAKFCAKTAAGYRLDEIDASRTEYLWALLARKDVSVFRTEKYTWGTHFGFDWRQLEKEIAANMEIARAYTRFATRIIVAKKS